MRLTRGTMVLAGALVIGGPGIGTYSAHAQCGAGGGGYYRGGGFGGGHTFGQSYGYYGGGYGCGMMMGGMPMQAAQPAATSMPGMNMSTAPAPAAPAPVPAAAAPATATAQYHCPMHPSVVASFPAKCPYCGMALSPR